MNACMHVSGMSDRMMGIVNAGACVYMGGGRGHVHVHVHVHVCGGMDTCMCVGGEG